MYMLFLIKILILEMLLEKLVSEIHSSSDNCTYSSFSGLVFLLVPTLRWFMEALCWCISLCLFFIPLHLQYLYPDTFTNTTTCSALEFSPCFVHDDSVIPMFFFLLPLTIVYSKYAVMLLWFGKVMRFFFFL